MKFVILLAVCTAGVLARPKDISDVYASLNALSLAEDKPAPPAEQPKANNKDETKPATDDKSSDAKTTHWYDKWADFVEMDLTSMGRVGNNPNAEEGVNGKTYHKLEMDFKPIPMRLYLDHVLEEFESGDGGTLGLGMDYKTPIGTLSLKAGQSFNSPGNGSLDWSMDFDNEALREYLHSSSSKDNSNKKDKTSKK